MEEYCEMISSEVDIGYHIHECPEQLLPAQDLKNIKPAKFPHREALLLLMNYWILVSIGGRILLLRR